MELKDYYIAGPMTGLPELNYPAFHQAEKFLTEGGLTVENPAHNSAPSGEWEDYMRLGLTQLLRCRRLYMLNGWESSKGAVFELYTARLLGMEVHFQNGTDK